MLTQRATMLIIKVIIDIVITIRLWYDENNPKRGEGELFPLLNSLESNHCCEQIDY